MPQAETKSSKPEPIGPLAGIVIIILMLLAGAVYFGIEQFEAQRNIEPPPYIPGDQT